jgi:hypothetical protein
MTNSKSDEAQLTQSKMLKSVQIAINKIATCESVAELKNWRDNARKLGHPEVEEAAFRRLASRVPQELVGSIEHDFWTTINAIELILSDERGKTIRLSRTRQKVGRVGVVATLRDWATSAKETDMFRELLERDMPEFTGEAIVLRHHKLFTELERTAANQRLIDAGVDVERLPLTSPPDAPPR